MRGLISVVRILNNRIRVTYIWLELEILLDEAATYMLQKNWFSTKNPLDVERSTPIMIISVKYPRVSTPLLHSTKCKDYNSDSALSNRSTKVRLWKELYIFSLSYLYGAFSVWVISFFCPKLQWMHSLKILNYGLILTFDFI